MTGATIRVEFTDGVASWQPASAVVFYGSCATAGPAASVCCGYLRFFTDQATATDWASQHPEVTGAVLGQHEAERLGAQIFGPSLIPDPAAASGGGTRF